MKFAPDSFPQYKKFWGLLEYKPQWTLTVKGWIIIIIIFLISGLIFIKTIHPFLAMDDPVDADILIVEGWVGDIVIKGALDEFKQGNYKIIITTGTPLLRGSFLSQYKSYAEMTAATLMALGISDDQIISITTPDVTKDRTAASAEAVNDWVTQSNLKIKGINIYTYDVHARRSWYVFKQVLAPNIQIGAIAYPGEYNYQKWWTSSSGVRSVISETIAYVYARFIWRN